MLICSFAHKTNNQGPLAGNASVYRAFITRHRPVNYISFVLYNTKANKVKKYARAFLHQMETFSKTRYANTWTVVLFHDGVLPSHYFKFLTDLLPSFRHQLVDDNHTTNDAKFQGHSAKFWRFHVHDFPDTHAYFCCDADTGLVSTDYKLLDALESDVDFVHSTVNWNVKGLSDVPACDVIPAGSWGVNRDKFSFVMESLISTFYKEHPDVADSYSGDEVFLYKTIRPLVATPEYTQYTVKYKPRGFAEASRYKQVCEPLCEGNMTSGKFAAFIEKTRFQGWTTQRQGRGKKRVLHNITNTPRLTRPAISI